MKFGGTSVADLERIRRVGRLVAAEVAAGHQVAVVVSAMSGKTNELVAWTDGSGRPAQRSVSWSASRRQPCGVARQTRT